MQNITFAQLSNHKSTIKVISLSISESIAIYFAAASAIFVEGETALITSSLAAKIGYLSFPVVFVCAYLATLAYDWIFFITGRWKGRILMENRQGLVKMKNRIDRILTNYPTIFLFGYRFLYGFRGAICIIIGLSEVKTKKFIIFSTITTLIWTGIYSGLGYFFGKILEKKINDIQKSGPIIIGVLVAIGVLLTVIFAYFSRKRLKKGP